MSKKAGFANRPTEILELQKDVLQAVVMCDTFSNEFFPLALIKPVALFPLVNTPLLDYTLEFLAAAGVQEAIVFCAYHVASIKEHIRHCKWRESTSPMLVNILVLEQCRSLGDAMRYIDDKGVIRGDFILLNAHTIANIPLLPIIEKHRLIQKQDKGSVMTVVYKSASPGHRVRQSGDDTLLAVHSTSGRILFHKKLGQRSKKVSFPLELFLDNAGVELHYDLYDTGICVCSNAVPPLFSDNFDFQTRDDFVRGLLLNEDILASTLYYHPLHGAEYAVQASSWHMYQAVSHDVIHRWIYPFVPDIPLTEDREPYMFLRQNVYRQKAVTLAKGCILEEDVVIGENSTVGENSVITRSVIGKNCHIGRNTTIQDSFVWDNTRIEDECFVRDSVVASDCLLGNRGSLTTGCVVGPTVRLKPGIQLEGLSVLSAYPVFDELGSFERSKTWERMGNRVWMCRSGGVAGSSSGVGATPQPPASLFLGSEADADDGDGSGYSSGSSDNMSHRDSPIPDDTSMFYNEVFDSLARGFEDRLACDNLILEINSSRYAYNVSINEVNFHVVYAVLNLPEGAVNYLPRLVKLIEYFLPILSNYIRRSKEAQMECLQAIEEVAECRVEVRDGLAKLLHLLYDKDVLEEAVLIQWFNSPPNPDLPSSAQLRTQVAAFIQWLQEADEESDSD